MGAHCSERLGSWLWCMLWVGSVPIKFGRRNKQCKDNKKNNHDAFLGLWEREREIEREMTPFHLSEYKQSFSIKTGVCSSPPGSWQVFQAQNGPESQKNLFVINVQGLRWPLELTVLGYSILIVYLVDDLSSPTYPLSAYTQTNASSSIRTYICAFNKYYIRFIK